MLIPDHLPPIIGHEGPQELIYKAFESSRFPHAWILRGVKGIGKFNFALHLSYALFKNKITLPFQIDVEDPLFKRMKSGGHGDLIILALTQDEKGKVAREISAQQVRSITSKLTQTAFEGGWRIVIVDGVENLNRHGANALLKTLEEPPHQTLFLLVTSSLGRLLPTIRSRCQILNFAQLLDSEMKSVLLSLNPNLKSQDLEILLPLAQGSPGRIQHLLALGGLDFCQNMVKAFAHLKAGSLKEVLAFAYTHGDDPEIYEIIEDYIRADLVEGLLEKAQNDLSSEATQTHLKLWDEVTQLFQESRKADLDRKATLSTVLSTLSLKTS
ncbi:DNA polymerase III subunit delta' [Candidatus Bealeia paramacronuclearis]|uniref:DNA polymerase III subunit delta n=1 Tax=Candidatus Bealeia paramacronuclearis TaxID=1921001 RepID=A0ABZ2C523_9PROT|nr:DNA polymerase III subunit delta' [Candidatus Bealeia paramacronuclearis]